ncbi:MAG: hypothetical protein XD66_1404 [Thermacetogenium phaeum]|uniref:Uncharacterized protein n=1 Tax=Thermacetogenium phaeum TaxID=85874 RepID=A0A124FK24_9THEO|nr:MAG: hypothetical protein XD66_1404 [Thermacetogenium phaeum]
MFLAYLRGIETHFEFFSWAGYFVFLAYLRGIETQVATRVLNAGSGF